MNLPAPEILNTTDLSHVWLAACSCLILLIPAGLALLATGLTRSKNATHTAFMTFFGSAIGVLGLWAFGFGLMEGHGFFLRHLQDTAGGYAHFFWQAALVSIVISIPSGALAERWNLKNFSVYCLFVSVILFPFACVWVRGSSWVANRGFVDFAGSGFLHLVGGCSALAGAALIGPRIGRYNREGALVPLPAHNVPMALTGCFLITVGWVGLNVAQLGDAAGRIAVVTILAGAAGAVVAAGWMIATTRKPDPTITMNGLLAGLVASSASSVYVGPSSAVLIGAVAGALVCLAVRIFDKWRIDDPVGAISVHGVGGFWGLLAVGIFTRLHGHWNQLGAQALGAVILAAWSFGATWLFFKIVGRFIPLRVPPEVEMEGLDISETGIVAYPESQQMNSFGSGFSQGPSRR